MIAFGLSRILLHLLVGLWTCAVVFPLTDAAGRSWRIQHWSLKLLAICGIEVVVRHTGAATSANSAQRCVVVSNHVSWLDIFVINTLQAQRFVAKSELRGWPLLGWLAAKAGTIFIARGRVRDVRRIFENLVHSIRNGEHVAFFPEGTTAAQGQLLPFHANLFEAAIDASVPIQPIALRYLNPDGTLAERANYIGDTSFADSMLTILRGGPLRAELILLAPIESAGVHRRDLANAARQTIGSALGQ